MQLYKLIIQYTDNTYGVYYTATRTQAEDKAADHSKWYGVTNYTIIKM